MTRTGRTMRAPGPRPFRFRAACRRIMTCTASPGDGAVRGLRRLPATGPARHRAPGASRRASSAVEGQCRDAGPGRPRDREQSPSHGVSAGGLMAEQDPQGISRDNHIGAPGRAGRSGARRSTGDMGGQCQSAGPMSRASAADVGASCRRPPRRWRGPGRHVHKAAGPSIRMAGARQVRPPRPARARS